MIIEILGLQIEVLALVVFMFSVLFATEGVKAIFKNRTWYKVVAWECPNLFPVLISWAAGAMIFFPVSLLSKTVRVSFNCILQFAFATLLLNGGYRLLKPLIRGWMKGKGWQDDDGTGQNP